MQLDLLTIDLHRSVPSKMGVQYFPRGTKREAVYPKVVRISGKGVQIILRYLAWEGGGGGKKGGRQNYFDTPL